MEWSSLEWSGVIRQKEQLPNQFRLTVLLKVDITSPSTRQRPHLAVLYNAIVLDIAILGHFFYSSMDTLMSTKLVLVVLISHTHGDQAYCLKEESTRVLHTHSSGLHTKSVVLSIRVLEYYSIRISRLCPFLMLLLENDFMVLKLVSYVESVLE
jgi:hypothetical protein